MLAPDPPTPHSPEELPLVRARTEGSPGLSPAPIAVFDLTKTEPLSRTMDRPGIWPTFPIQATFHW